VWEPVVVDEEHPACASRRIAAYGANTLFLNLCDGSEEDGDGYPGLAVVRALERGGRRFTGADASFYDVSTSKLRMKRALRRGRVPTPRWIEIAGQGDVGRAAELGFPLLVKPEISAASLGINARARVEDEAALADQVAWLRRGGHDPSVSHGAIFVEPFLDGAELTVMVVGPAHAPVAFPPVERAYNPRLPRAERFLCFEIYDTYSPDQRIPELGDEPFFLYQRPDRGMSDRAARMAERAYRVLGGNGYARVDLRATAEGELFVLEVNANCGLGTAPDSSTGNICRLSGIPFATMLRAILDHGETRDATALPPASRTGRRARPAAQLSLELGSRTEPRAAARRAG
jgi:D-alanine-D-alanine ligase